MMWNNSYKSFFFFGLVKRKWKELMCAPWSNVSSLHITLFQLCATAKSVTLIMLIDGKIYHFIDGDFPLFFLAMFFLFRVLNYQ